MNEFDFEKLKNIKIDFPESWVENALEIPSKEHKKPAPILFYRYAAGIAACVVMGLAVILTMIFGIGKNTVSLTKPDTDYSSGYSVTPDGTIPSGTGDYNAPTDNLPVIFGTDNGTSPAVTEPYEYSENTDDKANPAAKPNGQSANRQAARGGTQNNGNGNKAQNATASSGDTQPLTDSPTEPPVTQEPPEETDPWVEPWYPPPTEYYPSPTETPTVEPSMEGELSFFTIADASLASGYVYCRLEDKNGNIQGSGGLFSNSRRTQKYKTAYADQVILIYDCYYDIDYFKTYTVIFYNSNGDVIKQRTLMIEEPTSYQI